jgi:tRNA dimethylallyltransferase
MKSATTPNVPSLSEIPTFGCQASRAAVSGVKVSEGRTSANAASLNAADSWIQAPIVGGWFLSGPTASGKTRVAIPLAKRINAEIVSLDSMAVYKDMDIGTAKPTKEDRDQVPHHLIDMVDPTDEYSVSQFVIDAHRVVSEIRSRGKEVLFVGGTPLYLKTLLRGMFLGPPADWDFREQVEADIETFGMQALRDRVMQVDPISAHRILPEDKRRMIRVLEVSKITGQPLSHWQTQFERLSGHGRNHVFVLGWERKELHERVEKRVHEMFDRGLVAEVKMLLDRYHELGRTAMQAVGYKEPIDYLRGKASLDQTIEKVLIHTRQFVRRQEIWFRSIKEIQRISVDSSMNSDTIADRLAGLN